MNVELRRFDDHVGKLADRFHQRAFVRQTFAHGKILSQGMRAPRLTVAPQKGVLVRFDEDKRDGMFFLKMLQEWREFFEL